MPKYPLILSNKNFVKCLQICAKKGCSMGRLLNDFVNEGINKYDGEPDKPVCCQCERDPAYEVYSKEGKRLYYCEQHFQKETWRAYKKIGV